MKSREIHTEGENVNKTSEKPLFWYTFARVSTCGYLITVSRTPFES